MFYIFETYHFLKLRLPEIGGSSCGGICGGGIEGLVYSQRTIENPFQYVFTNSDNKEVSYTAQLSSYINNVTIQLYTEYFLYENIWDNSNKYYIVDENFIQQLVKDTSQKFDVKGKAIFHPLRIVLFGKPDGPDLFTLISILGIKETQNRLLRYI